MDARGNYSLIWKSDRSSAFLQKWKPEWLKVFCHLCDLSLSITHPDKDSINLYSSVTQVKISSQLHQKVNVRHWKPWPQAQSCCTTACFIQRWMQSPELLASTARSPSRFWTIKYSGFGNQLLNHMKNMINLWGEGDIFANHLCLNNSKLYGPNTQYYSETSKRLNCQQDMS